MNILKQEKALLKLKKKQKKIDSNFLMKRSKQKKHKRDSTKNIEQATKDEEADPKTKVLIKFDKSDACSVKSLAVKKYQDVIPTIRFLSGKMIYEIYMIDYIFPYHALKDTDSTCTF